MTSLTEPTRAQSFVVSEAPGTLSREAVTIASGTAALSPGAVVGRLPATGEYTAYDQTATNGSEVAAGIVLEAVDASAAAAAVAILARQAEVATARVSYTGSRVKASLATGVVGNNNAITWTARDYGRPGNLISVALVDPSGNNQPLAVSVLDLAVTVSLATNGAGTITSTADEVKAAVAALDAANALVVGTDTSTSDGTGVVAAVAATRLSGGKDPITDLAANNVIFRA